MLAMNRRPLVLLTLVLLSPVLQAGECRTALRPLLLDATPDPVRLGQVRELCGTEAGAGDADALYQLALMDLGLAGRFEPDAAVPRIRQAAEAGVPEAQYWMAWQSEAGPLLPNDVPTARGWYEKAAEAEHRLALERLAVAYEKGELGLEPDVREALALRARIRRCDDESL
jgi:hypothetical protein